MPAFNAKRRSPEQLLKNVTEWIEKKYLDPRKDELRKQLWKGDWKFGLIVGNVKSPEELELIRRKGIEVVLIASILREIQPNWSAKGTEFIIGSAAGADLVDLMFAHSQLISSLTEAKPEAKKRNQTVTESLHLTCT